MLAVLQVGVYEKHGNLDGKWIDYSPGSGPSITSECMLARTK